MKERDVLWQQEQQQLSDVDVFLTFYERVSVSRKVCVIAILIFQQNTISNNGMIEFLQNVLKIKL